MRILVVDADPDLRKLIANIVRGEHEAVVLRTGREATNLLRDDDHFDAVLLEVGNSSVTGLDVFKRIKKKHGHLETRVVFWTTEGNPLNGLVEDEGCPILIKPVDPSQLVFILALLVADEIVEERGSEQT